MQESTRSTSLPGPVHWGLASGFIGVSIGLLVFFIQFMNALSSKQDSARLSTTTPTYGQPALPSPPTPPPGGSWSGLMVLEEEPDAVGIMFDIAQTFLKVDKTKEALDAIEALKDERQKDSLLYSLVRKSLLKPARPLTTEPRPLTEGPQETDSRTFQKCLTLANAINSAGIRASALNLIADRQADSDLKGSIETLKLAVVAARQRMSQESTKDSLNSGKDNSSNEASTLSVRTKNKKESNQSKDNKKGYSKDDNGDSDSRTEQMPIAEAFARVGGGWAAFLWTLGLGSLTFILGACLKPFFEMFGKAAALYFAQWSKNAVLGVAAGTPSPAQVADHATKAQASAGIAGSTPPILGTRADIHGSKS